MNKKLVFIVDDDHSIRKITKKILEEKYEVETFSHFNDIKRRLTKKTPDLMILDVMFSDENITSFLEYREGHVSISHIPVIIFSALKNKKIINKVLTYKINDYIVKPFNKMLLETAVNRVLDKKKIKPKRFKDLTPFKVHVPIVIKNASEITLIAETTVRLEENHEYEVHSKLFKECDFVSENMQVLNSSSLSTKLQKFITKFRLKGASEKLLAKIRSGKT